MDRPESLASASDESNYDSNALLSALPSTSISTSIPSAKLSVYESPRGGFRFKHPAKWVSEGEQFGTMANFTLEPRTAATQQPPSMNVVVQSLDMPTDEQDPDASSSSSSQDPSAPTPAPLDLEQYTQLSLAQMGMMLQDVAEPASLVRDTTLGGLPAKSIEYQTTLGTPRLYRFYQVWAVYPPAACAYVVTFSSEAAQHSRCRPLVDAALSTFEVFEPQPEPLEELYLDAYYSDKHHLVITFPRTWERAETLDKNPLLVAEYNSTLSSLPTEPVVHLDLAFAVEQIKAEFDLEKFSKYHLTGLGKRLGKKLTAQDTTLAGIPAKEVSYTSNTKYPGAKYLQVYAVRGESAFILTFCNTAKDDDLRPYPIFERIRSGFVFNDRIAEQRKQLRKSILYENLKYKFSLWFPDSFAVPPTSEGLPSTIAFLKPDEEERQYHTNVNVVAKDCVELGATEASLAALEEAIRVPLDAAENGIKVLDTSSIIMSGQPGRQMIYTANLGKAIPEFNFKIKFMQRFTVKGDLAFVLTFAAKSNRFDRELSMVRHHLDTFSLW